MRTYLQFIISHSMYSGNIAENKTSRLGHSVDQAGFCARYGTSLRSSNLVHGIVSGGRAVPLVGIVVVDVDRAVLGDAACAQLTGGDVGGNLVAGLTIAVIGDEIRFQLLDSDGLARRGNRFDADEMGQLHGIASVIYEDGARCEAHDVRLSLCFR